MALLIGNSLAVLVGAYELARSGRHVTLLTDGKSLGGHFSGIYINGQGFDIGMLFFEKYHSNNSGEQRLRTYNANVRNDWIRFGDLLSNWLEVQVGPLQRVPTPDCLIEQHTVPDYLISNRLEVFTGAMMSPEIFLSKNDERHAANKLHAVAYENISYAEAASLNHGDVLHSRFIEPFVRKLVGATSTNFLARYHRAVWVPLYYPETLKSAALSEQVTLPEYPFWTTKYGFVGQLIQVLCDELQKSPFVTLINTSLQSLKFNTGMWTAVTSDANVFFDKQLALGLSSDRAQYLLGTEITQTSCNFASVTLLFSLVRADAIRLQRGCLMIVDENYAAYRLSNQDVLAGLQTEWQRVVIESNPERLASQYPNISAEAALERELRSLLSVKQDDAVRILKCVTVKNALLLPTFDTVITAKATHNAFSAAAPGAILTANLLGYGVASLNDQLVQGLMIAEDFS